MLARAENQYQARRWADCDPAGAAAFCLWLVATLRAPLPLVDCRPAVAAACGGLPPSPRPSMHAAAECLLSSLLSALQVKDVMAHLYFKAKESFAQQAPKEVGGWCKEVPCCSLYAVQRWVAGQREGVPL